MKIFLATAKLDELHVVAESGLIDGVTATPALLAAEIGDGDWHEHLALLARSLPVTIFASVESVSAADIYRDGKELARLSDRMVVQVPLVEDAVPAIRRLSTEGVRVAAMLVFDAAQALLAAKAGATAVFTSLEHLDAVGHDGAGVVQEMRTVFEIHGIECDVYAAHPENAAQFAACARAGADGVVVTLPVLRNLLVHPLTDRGLDRFLNDLSRHHRLSGTP